MELRAYHTNGVDVIDLSGQVETEDAVTIRDWFHGLLAQGARRIVFHLGHVSTMSLFTLGTLAERKREADAVMAKVKICGLDEKLAETFKALGGERVLDVSETAEKAIREFAEVA